MHLKHSRADLADLFYFIFLIAVLFHTFYFITFQWLLRILYDDFDEKVKNIHDEMDLHHSYKKKACIYCKRKSENREKVII